MVTVCITMHSVTKHVNFFLIKVKIMKTTTKNFLSSFFIVSFIAFGLVFFIVIKTNAQTSPDSTGMGSSTPNDQSLQMPTPPADATQAMGPAPATPTDGSQTAAPASPTDGSQAATTAPVAVPADGSQAVAPAAPVAAPVVAEVLSGPDIVQLTEDKVALVKSDDPKIGTAFDDSEKLRKDRADLIKSMAQAAQSLKDKFTDQEIKLADFYQSFEFEEGKTQKLFAPIKEEKEA